MDDERLKNGRYFGEDYFKELLERIRSIRASERRIYLQITDIFQECSIDYDPNSKTTKDFFATVQNKFHFAITGKTAAEIIYEQADKTKMFMGLKTWKSAPTGRILKSDIQIAKSIDKFLMFNEYEVLEGKGSISMKTAQEKAINEYGEFNKTQKIENDFEKQVIKSYLKSILIL